MLHTKIPTVWMLCQTLTFSSLKVLLAHCHEPPVGLLLATHEVSSILSDLPWLKTIGLLTSRMTVALKIMASSFFESLVTATCIMLSVSTWPCVRCWREIDERSSLKFTDKWTDESVVREVW